MDIFLQNAMSYHKKQERLGSNKLGPYYSVWGQPRYHIILFYILFCLLIFYFILFHFILYYFFRLYFTFYSVLYYFISFLIFFFFNPSPSSCRAVLKEWQIWKLSRGQPQGQLSVHMYCIYWLTVQLLPDQLSSSVHFLYSTEVTNQKPRNLLRTRRTQSDS